MKDGNQVRRAKTAFVDFAARPRRPQHFEPADYGLPHDVVSLILCISFG
jgi:hypothetical protein